ncbi:hypothetical protein ACFLWR_07015, partial [Chloroflexota bacterium]
GRKMNAFNLRRGKEQQQKNNSVEKLNNKTQFNIIINKNIKEEVQKTGKILRVNQSEISEHLLQIGLYHTKNTLEDPDKRKLYEKHLETSHLLDEPDQDEDVVIRMTENNRNWILLDYTRKLSGRINKLTMTMQRASKMQNPALFKEAERGLNREMAKYASLILNFMEDEE